MATESTAVPKKATALRHRTHTLDGRTHSTHSITLASGSVTSSDSGKDFASDFEEKEAEKERLRRPVLVEVATDSSDDGDEEVDTLDGPEVSGSRNITPPTAPLRKSELSRAWYEFDLAVLVALVSPIGNWLTGGDYIKNVFLIMLLLYYLHQIIEVPWQLYHKARPRRRAPYIPTSTADDHYKHVATSELRALELFFLALAVASPLLGAQLLRYATAAVIGPEAVSWFNTALFVLATGMRPWRHVIERLLQRTTDLHDVIHYPSPGLSSDDVRTQMVDMIKRVEHLERALSKAKARLVDTTEEVYDYVEEAVAVVDRTVKRHEKKYEKQEVRVREMELALEGMKGKGKQRASGGLTIETAPPAPSLLTKVIPGWIFLNQRAQRSAHSLSPSPSSHSPPAKHGMRSFPSASSMHLQPIPEEEAAKYPVLTRPADITSLVLSRVGYVATMPLRAVLRMILRNY
ncbi:hypothetical protein DXG01_010017 [Tephrocybe rancida]|nr:hypothetical protein DXG01_010017 [Tephrocybe rancida]